MLEKKSHVESVEKLYSQFEKVKDNQFYTNEQIYEFDPDDKININFVGCKVAICPNGGLIAICKKKDYLDTSRNSKINHNIIVMYQTAKKRYYIPIDWEYKKRYFILFDFNEKEQLYGICNDGTIYKINILTSRAVEKITSQKFATENIEKAQLYEGGFIALTTYGNFYYVKNIKNALPELLFEMKTKLRFSNNIEFLIIPPEVSKTKKMELLITNERGLGVVNVEKTEDATYFILPVEDDNSGKLMYKGISVLNRDVLEPFIVEDDILYNTKEEKKEDDNIYLHENLRKIAAMAISPSKKNIAFYDTRGIVFFFSSTLDQNLEKNPRKKVEISLGENLSSNEAIEQQMVINFGEGYQFLFCGEDAVLLAGLRIIFFIHKSGTSTIYKVKELNETLALKGIHFCKCISEVDGARYLTNEGIFFISKVNKELVNVCDPFSETYSKKLILAYQKHLDHEVESEKSLKEIENHLVKAVNSLEISAANIFWLDNQQNENIEKKNVQLFILKAAQYGKNFLKKEEFNFEKFLEICKDIRCVNNIRNSKIPKLISFEQYKSLDHKDLIKKLMRILNFGIAFEICNYLDYSDKKVYKRYTIAKIKSLSYKANVDDEERLFRLLNQKLKNVPNISFIKLAKKAFKYHRNVIGMRFLENEKSALSKIPQLIDLTEWDKAVDIAENMFDSKIINTLLYKIYKKEGISYLVEIVKDHPKTKTAVIQFLNNTGEIELIENILLLEKNPEELFFFYLEQYYNVPSFFEKKKYVMRAKEKLNILSSGISPNFEYKFYKNYLESLEQSMIIKLEVQEKCSINSEEELNFDISAYDTFKLAVKGIKENNHSQLENMNKIIGFSQEGMSLMRILSLCEMNRFEQLKIYMDENKNQIKKKGLSYLNIAEIFYKYEIYDKAIEYIVLINDPVYINYKLDMSQSLNNTEAELEVIISDKNIGNKSSLVNDILKSKPELQIKVDEFCDKYKVSLK